MKKTKLFVSLIMGISAIFCGYIAKTNAVQLNINDDFFTGGILTGNYAEIHFQENNNDGYGVFFVGSGKTVDATLILTDRASTNKIKCNKQLNGYYIIPYTNYQVLGLDTDTVNYTNENNLTNDINIITGGLFYGCRYDGYNYNTAINGIYGYIKREYGSNSDVKNIHEIRVGLKKPNDERTDPWDWHSTSPLQQAYSTTTGNHSRTLYGQFYSSLARSGLVSPRPIGDLKFTNSNITYSGDIDQYDISVYEYAENGIDLQILSAKPNQTGTIKLTYVDNAGHPGQINRNIETQSSMNDFGFLGETGYLIEKTAIQIKPDSTGKITLTYPGENGNPDRSFSINFRITDENFYPCLTGYDHKFLTQDFWNQSPTNYNIKCAIFGYSGDSGYGTYSNYKTAYTSGRNDGVNCTQVEVEITSTLPDSLHDNTIYVLSGVYNDEITINDITMGECSAIVSPSKLNIGNDVTLKGGSITFNSNSKHSVLDNISVKGGGIEFNNSENNTINMVKIYNTINGILINNNSQHILLNNVQSFNNNYGIKILNSASNAINNTQVYRNTNGVYMEGSTNNIIYNSNITLNNIGLFVTTGSQHNIFKSLLINNNNNGSHTTNIFIRHGTTDIGPVNTGEHIAQSIDNYFMEYTGVENLYGYQTSMEISGFIWTWKRSAKEFPYTYFCQGGTSGTCHVQTTGEQYLFECTGTRHTVEEEGNSDSFRNISANGLMIQGPSNNEVQRLGLMEYKYDTRSLNITKGSDATFQTNDITQNMIGQLIQKNNGYQYNRFSGGEDNMRDAFFIGYFDNDNSVTIQYKLPIPIGVDDEGEVIYEDINERTPVMEYTGSRYETFIDIVYTGATGTQNLDSFGDELCIRDGGLSYYETGSENYGPYRFYRSGYIFSYHTGLTMNNTYTNVMTNPELSHDTDELNNEFLNPWTVESHGNGTINNVIKRYSYGVSIKTQKDVLLSTLEPGGKVNTNFYIGSNVPKATTNYLNGYDDKKITKTHYRFGITGGNFNTIPDPDPTNYHVITLKYLQGGLSNVNTILGYTVGPYIDWPNQIWDNYTHYHQNYTQNKYMTIAIGTGIDIYTNEGNQSDAEIKGHPIVYQIYNTGNYYFTHNRTKDIRNVLLSLTIAPTRYCIRPDVEKIIMTGTFSNYEGDTTGFYLSSITGQRTNSANIVGEITGFDKKSTGVYQRDFYIPCYTGDHCTATASIPQQKQQLVKDILNFKLSDTTPKSKTYVKDHRGPNINITTGTAEECSTHTITVSLYDDCAGPKKFDMYSQSLGNTGWSRTSSGMGWNPEIWLTSGQIGNIAVGAPGYKPKTGHITAEDWYENDRHYNYYGGNTTYQKNFSITITNTGVTLQRGKDKGTDKHFKYTGGNGITYYMSGGYAEITGFITTGGEHGAEHAELIVNPIELLGAKEGNCGTGDLYVAAVQCYTGIQAFSGIDPRFNFTGDVLTGKIVGEQEVEIFHINKTFDIVTCAFNIKDNEGSSVTGYIGFRINTLHVPLIDPEIISGEKYINYSGFNYNGITYPGKTYSHGENEKYSSGDLISIHLHANDCVKEYYASCDDYYYRSGMSHDPYNENNTGITRNNIPGYTGFYLSGCKGDDIDNFSGRQTPIKISVRNGETGYNGFFTNIGNTEDIIYDYTSPYTELRNADDQKIIAYGQSMTMQIRVSDQFNINDRLVNDNGQLNDNAIEQIKLTIDTGNCSCKNDHNTCFTGIEAKFKPSSSDDNNIRILTISGIVNISGPEGNRCEGGNIHIKINSGFVYDFAGNESTLLSGNTNYIYTNKTAIFIEEGIRKNNTIDRRVATKNVERIDITGELKLTLLSNLPIESSGNLACTGFDQTGHFICLSLTGGTINQQNKEICKERNKDGVVPSCNIIETGKVIFNHKYEVGFTICSLYNQGEERIGECTGHYSTNDTTGNSVIYGNLIEENNPYNEDYAKIILYRQKSPFKAGQTQNETFFYGELIKALQDGDGDNGFIFYISHPQKIRTGNVSGGTIGEISYDLNFSTGVADEFYYITGEAIVNGFKQSRSIKRPTYNYSNPKGYLFNFPDYENYE